MENKKNVVMVIGPAQSGQSQYIKKNYPNYTKVDLSEIQKCCGEKEDVFEKCIDEFEDALSKNDNVVLEHTLPKIRHRIPYLKALEKYKKSSIEMVIIYPKQNQLKKTSKLKQFENYNKIFEPPSILDGFSEIVIVN